MMNPRLIDQLTAGIAAALPPGIGQLQADLEQTIRAAVTAALSRMDLVTREEFDVQSAVLARTRARLEALEQKVLALEEQLLDPPDSP
ncbi:MAG: accessory factor UbiK family protein [Gammaproteobacteria bacterium]|nr:accessory factor UbiK family protein [Gammaproteobacteria bacterium]